MFRKVLIANRGEIALRILRACRELGVEAVVAYSEADRESLAVQLADEAICIGPAEAARSYLSAPAVISAALVTGCDAIHPGYGFLSEDEGFAEIVAAHDLTFIGPPAEVLERFASKAGTRQLLGGHGLPTIPGSDGMLRDDLHALSEAERIGYPVLIKPSAGGGGKGMRMVRTPRELQQALRVCRSEAQAAFGDDSLYLEKWLEENRHVEVQVVVDRFGHGVHVGRARLLGPAPPPEDPRGGPDPGARRGGPGGPRRAGRPRRSSPPATRTSARSSSSSTATGSAYFIEINCRIQVEHPVTEMLSGIDLVASQIRIAAGEPLGYHPGRRRDRAATPSSSASTPRTRSTTSGPRPASSSATSRRAARACAWTRTCTAATRSRRTTTRCSASSSSGARTGHRPSPAAGPRSTSWCVDGVVTNVAIHQALLASETFLDGRMTTNLLDRVGSAAFLAAAARA